MKKVKIDLAMVRDHAWEARKTAGFLQAELLTSDVDEEKNLEAIHELCALLDCLMEQLEKGDGYE